MTGPEPERLVDPDARTPLDPGSSVREFSLKEGIDAYRWTLDYTHKMLAYFQALMIGAAAFAWTGENPRDGWLLILTSLGVLAFGIPNGRLVHFYQNNACTSAKAINSYWDRHPESITTEFRNVRAQFKPTDARIVWVMHLLLLLATLAAIWFRTAQPILPSWFA